MHIHCGLIILILALGLNEQVDTGKIIGGHHANKNSSRYMVLLETGKTKHCGGFLLSKDFVMTAAHCKDSSDHVYVGLYDYTNKIGVDVIPVEKFFPHVDYHEGHGYKNDLMLLKLRSEAKLGQTVPLAGLGDKPSNSCIVYGWGRHDDTGKMSPILNEVSVKLNDSMPCDNEYFYCSDGREGPAKGDSGGPLVCEDGKAYGVVSYDYGDGNIPGTRFYASIPKARDWIDSIMTSLIMLTEELSELFCPTFISD